MNIAEVAQVAYTEYHVRLAELSDDLASAGDRERASVIRHRAFIAYVAARAERRNPKPKPSVRWLER